MNKKYIKIRFCDKNSIFWQKFKIRYDLRDSRNGKNDHLWGKNRREFPIREAGKIFNPITVVENCILKKSLSSIIDRFSVTITATGLSTFLIGLLPAYDTIGIAAPILLVILRCTQGLAVGGEYGGAATYIAEYAPQNQRGLYTGFIQASAIGGDFTCVLVVISCQLILGKEKFELVKLTESA